MRTNIILNDELVREAMQYAGKSTSKSALVEEALRTYVEVRSKEERRQRYQDKLLKVQQAVVGRKLRTSAMDLLRQDRDRG